jgi:hypothetical protein
VWLVWTRGFELSLASTRQGIPRCAVHPTECYLKVYHCQPLRHSEPALVCALISTCVLPALKSTLRRCGCSFIVKGAWGPEKPSKVYKPPKKTTINMPRFYFRLTTRHFHHRCFTGSVSSCNRGGESFRTMHVNCKSAPW